VNRHGAGFGKPQLPEVIVLSQERSLYHFVKVDSKSLFKLLHILSSFLGKPLQEWKDDDAYRFGKNVVCTLRVYNDLAERGVKLVADCLYLATEENNLQNYLQVVEDRRK